MNGLPLWEYPALVAGVLVALTVCGKAIRDAYRWFRNLDDTLRYVASEMRLNSGSTMRDAIARIEQRQENADAHRDELADAIDHLETHLTQQDAS